jgi:hypothetical protein
VDAARLMRVSYLQAKRLWKQHGEEGAGGLKHRSAGRRPKRAYPEKFPAKGVGAGAGEVRRAGRDALAPRCDIRPGRL